MERLVLPVPERPEVVDQQRDVEDAEGDRDQIAAEGGAVADRLAGSRMLHADVEPAAGPGLAAFPVVYRGAATGYRDIGLRPGRKYRYTVAVYDEAANRAGQTIEFVGRGALLNPAPGERVNSPPLLIWTAIRGATYYNVVLIRGRKVFSAWPSEPRIQLTRTWVYRGAANACGRASTAGTPGLDSGRSEGAVSATCWAAARPSSLARRSY